MGKKPLSGTAKLGVIQVRLTPDERTELDIAAAADGVPTSTWLRELGLKAARSRVSEPPSPPVVAAKKKPKSESKH